MRLATDPSQYARGGTNRFDGGLRAPTPRGRPRQAFGGNQINATKWQTNENQTTKEPAEL
jgi:hypothetical protein